MRKRWRNYWRVVGLAHSMETNSRVLVSMFLEHRGFRNLHPVSGRIIKRRVERRSYCCATAAEEPSGGLKLETSEVDGDV